MSGLPPTTILAATAGIVGSAWTSGKLIHTAPHPQRVKYISNAKQAGKLCSPCSPSRVSSSPPPR